MSGNPATLVRRRRAPGKGRRGRAAAALCLGLVLPACEAPVGSKHAKTNTASSDKPTLNAKPSPIVEDPNSDTPIDRLTVQSETVTAAELWHGFKLDLLAKREATPTDDFNAYLAQRAAQLITDRIAEMLLYQKAALRQPEEMQKRIDDYVDGEIRKTVTADHQGMQRRYERYLESRGTNLQETRTQLRRQFVIAGYLESELRPRVAEPTRAELWQAFENNRDRWQKPARRRMSLIAIRTTDLLPEGVAEPTREQQAAAAEEARSLVATVMSELDAGASFAEVARRHSHGYRAAEGGAWGWVDAESVRERFQPALAALDRLETGQTSDPIQTPDGWFVVHCDEHEPQVTPDFVTFQPQIKEWYLKTAYNKLISERIAELRAKARIEPSNLDRFHAAVVQAAVELLGQPAP